MQYPQKFMRLVGRQYNLLTRKQALEYISVREWRRLRAKGLIRPVRHGVFELGAVNPSWEQAVMAATLARPGSVASCQTAARLWGLDVPLDGISITAPRSANPNLEGVTVHRPLIRRPVTTVARGIPTTTVAQLVFDLAALLTSEDLATLLDQALRNKVVRLRDVRALLEVHGTEGYKGAATLKKLVEQRSETHERIDTDGEFDVFEWAASVGLPEPVLQFRVKTLTGHRRLDLAWPVYKIGVEVDDWWSHHTYSDLTKGTDRDLELDIENWRVFHVRKLTSRKLLFEAIWRALEAQGAFVVAS